MVMGSVILKFVRLYGYWFGYMVTGFGYMVTGFVIWLLVLLYGYWLGYIVTGLVIWLLV